MNKFALILGKGFDIDLNLQEEKGHYIETPYGDPSSKILSGKINNLDVLVIKRHGEDQDIPSYKVNYKSNIIALYELGCTHILTTSLCGSLQEEICAGDFVIFDQFIDWTKHRELTFIEELPIEKLNHSSFHQPFSGDLRNVLIESAVKLGVSVHTKGAVLAVDGPRQSTRAESNLYRHLGADVLNTTTAPEAILAHELGIPYATISLCTHYDSWRTDMQPVTFADKENVMINKKEILEKLFLQALEGIDESEA